MKKWMGHRQFLLTGDWHVHTNYTDGKGTVFEQCSSAERRGLPLIAFTEHVRKDLSYDFNDFLADIERARDAFDIVILTGCEAKVLPGGDLDAPDWILDQVDHAIMAVHSFKGDDKELIRSISTALRDPRVQAWAHPERGMTINDEEVQDMAGIMKDHDVLFEINFNSPRITGLSEAAKRIGVEFVNGTDAHDLV